MSKKSGEAPKTDDKTSDDATAQGQAQQVSGQADEGEQGEGEQQEQAADSQADDKGKDGEAEAQGKGKAKSPHVPDWRDGRMAKQAEKLRALEAEKQELATQLAALQNQRPQGERESDEVFQRRVDAAATKKAEALAKNASWNQQCEATAAAGKAEYGEAEFNASVAGLLKVVDTTDRESANAYAGMLNAAFATGEAPKVVFMLGQDPNEAARIMGLSPVEQGVALARLAAKEVAKPSKATKPISPVSSKGSARTEVDPRNPDGADELTTAEWMARRNKDIEAGKAGRGVRL